MITGTSLYKAASMLILAALLLCVPSLPAQAAPASEPARAPAALNNGLALTPPMGWNSWNRFGCNVTDALVRQMADAMVSSGMAAAGYKYIVIDDCWQATTRTNGHVNLDPDFPNMKALADYVHSKGLKFGLYSDRGTATCAGRAGSYGYEMIDAQDYASWGVDYLKYDNCNPAPGSNIQADYVRMRDALAATGRPIVYSICAWHYESWMPSVGNLWRTTGDIANNWNSMIGIPNTNNQTASVAGPGAWNDPDMLEVGNGGMTDTENRTHMSLWAIMAAPLMAGNDLRNMTQATRDILMAPEILAVDQDPLGKQGTRVWTGGSGNWLNVWSKQLSGTNVRAVALFNGTTSAANITVSWSQIGLPAGSATVRDLWARADRGSFNNSYTISVPAHGTVMLKIASGGSTPTPTPVTPTPVTPTPVTPTPVTSTPATPTPVTPTPVTPTPVTPTPGSGACSPVTGTVTAPFSYDGAGTFCWQIASIPNYINSWNLTSLTVNGVSFTNTYAFASNLPPKINGYWYVSYSGQYPWSHFEAK